MKIIIQKQIVSRLLFIVFLSILLLPAMSWAQQVKEDHNPLGFRTDLGLSVAIGGHACLGSSGSNWLECRGNNEGWSMGTGFAIAAWIRPWKYFSMGMDGAYMALRPTEGTNFDIKFYDRFTDLSFGAVFRGHYPIQIKRMLLDLGLGIRFAFVAGFLKSKPDADFQRDADDYSDSYTHRHYGPEIAPLLNADLFIIPKFGFGLELRAPFTVYQQVCFDQGKDLICRGLKDDVEDKVSIPIKLFYGLHVIYYM
jgi:hypothetical protein